MAVCISFERYPETRSSIRPIVPETSLARTRLVMTGGKILWCERSAPERSLPAWTWSLMSLSTALKASFSLCWATHSRASEIGTPVSTMTASWCAKVITSARRILPPGLPPGRAWLAAASSRAFSILTTTCSVA